MVKSTRPQSKMPNLNIFIKVLSSWKLGTVNFSSIVIKKKELFDLPLLKYNQTGKCVVTLGFCFLNVNIRNQTNKMLKFDDIYDIKWESVNVRGIRWMWNGHWGCGGLGGRELRCGREIVDVEKKVKMLKNYFTRERHISQQGRSKSLPQWSYSALF